MIFPGVGKNVTEMLVTIALKHEKLVILQSSLSTFFNDCITESLPRQSGCVAGIR
jgi:hypothetical protein